MESFGLEHMTQSDVEDYMNELCGDLNAHSISVAEFESESEVVADKYPFAYWNWIQ